MSPGVGVLTPGWGLNEHIVLLHLNNFFINPFLYSNTSKKPRNQLPKCEFHVPWGRGSDLKAGPKWLCSDNTYHASICFRKVFFTSTDTA